MPASDSLGTLYDVEIQIGSTSYWFRLDPVRPFQESDVTPWSTRVASGGAPGYDKQDLYVTVAQESFHHGMGFSHFSDQFGYSHSDATLGTQGPHVDTRFKGWAQIVTTYAAAAATAPSVLAVAAVDSTNNVHFAHGSSGWSRYSGSAWTTSNNFSIGSAQTANDVLVVANNSMFVSIDTNRLQTSTDQGDTWANAGNATNPPNNFGPMAIGAGRLWAVEDGRNELHYASAVDGSDWEGSGDANEIIVGPGVVAVNDLVWWNGNLYAGRPDDLYRIENERAYGVGFKMGYHANNFREMLAGPDGNMWMICRNKIYSWTGSGTKALVDRTPNPFAINLPFDGYGLFSSLSTRDGYIYTLGQYQGTLSNPTYHLLCWNGSGWHILADVTGSGASAAVGRVHASHAIDLLMTSATNGSGTVQYRQIALRDDSDLPSDSYQTSTFSAGAPTTNPHYLYSSRIHLGLLEIQKYIARLDIRSANLSATASSERMVDVYYQIDNDGTWRAWGTYNTSPYQSVAAPSTSNTCRLIQFRFNLVTGSATNSPFLDSYAFRLLPRPDALYGLSLSIRVADSLDLIGGTTDRSRTADNIRADCQTIRENVGPATIILPHFGLSYTGFCTSYSMATASAPDGRPEGRAILTFTEVTS